MEYYERRQSKRKQVADAIVALMHRSMPKVAKISEISCSGLSFLYSGGDVNLSEKLRMDILFLDEDIFWQQVPGSVVYDTVCGDYMPLCEQQKKRFGVKFDRLTAEQRTWLEQFVGI